MTTIAVRNGIIAADSCETHELDDGGHYVGQCRKLFRKGDAILGTYGESTTGMVFVDWYGSSKKPPRDEFLQADAEFGVIALTPDGVFLYDKWCRAERLEGEFFAFGTGAKVALGAMHAGASAADAVRIAALVDLYTRGPVITETVAERSPTSPTSARATARSKQASGT
jgi:hypothetical protein